VPDTIRIQATDEQSALALVASLNGLPGEAISEDGAHEVLVRPDTESAALLVELFQAIGRWLTDGRHDSCEIRFGDRSVTVIAPSNGSQGDATQFLLERARRAGASGYVQKFCRSGDLLGEIEHAARAPQTQGGPASPAAGKAGARGSLRWRRSLRSTGRA